MRLQREERRGWFVLDMQLVRSEALSEDTLSLVASRDATTVPDSRDSCGANVG